ncbi:MAG: hypothetical protein WBL68_12550 [Nitrososphaeraceae archaeon]
MKIIGTQKFSSLMYIACLTITSIAFGSLFATPQLLLAQGGANETFFEAAVREAGQGEQPNQTATAPAPSPQPSSTEQPNQTQSQNPFEQLGQAISKLFGGK